MHARPHSRLAGWSSAGIVLAALAIPLFVAWVAHLPPLAAAVPALARPIEGPSSTSVHSTTHVLASVRQLKLLTVTIDAAVRTTATDERWRGTAKATVEAPARFHYGVDLAGLDGDGIDFDYLTQTYTVSIPEPQLVAIEVDLAHPVREEIRTTGLRMDSISGQKQMIRAQRALQEHAQSFQLSPDQHTQMRQTTLEQTRAALTPLAGPAARVVVKYRAP